MKAIRLFVILALTTVPLYAQKRVITFNDLMAMRRVGAPQVSPDGRWVAYDLSTIDLPANKRKSAIYLIPAAGGTPQKITDGAKQDESPVWSPDGKWIAYVSNRDGATKQIYLYEVAGKRSVRFGNVENGAASVRWLPNGSGLVAVSDILADCGVAADCTKERNDKAASNPVKARVIDSLLYRHWDSWQGPTRSHIIHIPVRMSGNSPSAGEARDLTPGMFDAPPFSLGGAPNFDVSPDSRELVYASNTDKDAALSTNSDLYVVPLTGGQPRRITSRTGADEGPVYSPDGKWIAFRSQSRAGYESDLWELTLFDRQSGAITRVARDFPGAVNDIAWAPDTRSVFITSGEEQNVVISEIQIPSGVVKKLYDNGSASALSIDRAGRRLYFERASMSAPAEIFSIGRSGGVATALTRENESLLASLALGEVSDVWYDGAEGARVQALLVKPPKFDAAKKYPALVLIHGGPQGAWNDSWSFRWNAQMFAAQGYVVFLPNPRGSTGYGQKFVEEISGDWAGKVYIDIMNGVDRLVAFPYVDAARLAAAGGSYGGYMVNWILGHNDRFKALVSHAGVYNLDSMYGVTEETWFPEWEFKGNPWDNPELYERWSPHRFVKNFKTPTLVIHGELDYRVPVGEGMQLFTALQRRSVPSRFLVYPDEGHWILKPRNSQLWYSTVTDWLGRYLK
ncbi:MAG TPA: S9 family peptidase [Thermoanaerobaculia bacterium]|nr:S9 family peptidase [Thermoanaerobaculia bacterium]